MSSRSYLNQGWYATAKHSVHALSALLFRLRRTGLENVPREGGGLLVANHASHLDPPLVGSVCPRRLNFLARKTLFDNPAFGWLIRSLDAIPIDRDGMGLSGVKETLRRVRRGEMVLLFPEGTRSPDGRLAPLKPGVCSLARKGRAPIVPVGLRGTFDAWPRGRGLRLAPIHIHFGQPISPEEIGDLDDEQLLATIERRIGEAMTAGASPNRRPSS